MAQRSEVEKLFKSGTSIVQLSKTTKWSLQRIKYNATRFKWWEERNQWFDKQAEYVYNLLKANPEYAVHSYFYSAGVGFIGVYNTVESCREECLIYEFSSGVLAHFKKNYNPKTQQVISSRQWKIYTIGDG